MIQPNYTFQAKVTRVIDGDSVVMTVSPAFKIQLVDYKFRLYGIDAPEMNSTDEQDRTLARAAKFFVIENTLDKNVIVKTVKNTLGADKIDSFGRYLVIIYFQVGAGQVNLNDELVRLGMAKEWVP